MKTDREQVEEIQKIINDCYVVDSYIAAEGSEGGYIDTEEAAKALMQEGYGDVKQAQIDVLNELKEKCKFDGHTVAVYKNDIEEMKFVCGQMWKIFGNLLLSLIWVANIILNTVAYVKETHWVSIFGIVLCAIWLVIDIVNDDILCLAKQYGVEVNV